MHTDPTHILRASVSRLGVLALILAIVHFVLGQPPLDTLVVGIILALGYFVNSSGTGLAIDRSTRIFGINRRIISLTGAIVALISFLVLFAFNVTGLSVVGVVFSSWAVFDSVQHLRYDCSTPLTEDQTINTNEKMKEELLYMNIAGYVARSLLDCPKTESELANSLDLTESQLKRALEHLQATDTVYFDGNKYYARNNQFGYVALIRVIIHDVVQRIVKPFRMG